MSWPQNSVNSIKIQRRGFFSVHHSFIWRLWLCEPLDNDSNCFTLPYSFCCIIDIIQMSFSFTHSYQGEPSKSTTQTRETLKRWNRVSERRKQRQSGNPLAFWCFENSMLWQKVRWDHTEWWKGGGGRWGPLWRAVDAMGHNNNVIQRQAPCAFGRRLSVGGPPSRTH